MNRQAQIHLEPDRTRHSRGPSQLNTVAWQSMFWAVLLLLCTVLLLVAEPQLPSKQRHQVFESLAVYP